MKSVIYFVIVLLCCCSGAFYFVEANNCGDLFLTINAVTNHLEFNWDFTDNCKDPPDTLTLFYENSKLTTPKLKLGAISIENEPKGYFLSPAVFGKPEFPGNWSEGDENPILQSHCYPFWLQSTRKGEIIDTVCIKIEPTWMESFGQLQIGDMMIPGTHDTGAWTANAINVVKKYTFTQDYNVWGQLVSGIRYLDIRVGLYANKNPKEWINHGVVPCSKMEEELQHIANFLRKSPKEVVILHFHSFEYPLDFTDEDHQVVLDLVQRVLGEFILPRQNVWFWKGPTLEEIWATDKRLIISYNNRRIVRQNNWLWYNLNHKWGNKQKVEDLHDFLQNAKGTHLHPSTPFCALMAVLTPDLEYIVTNMGKSLRHMADEVNPRLNDWLRKENWTKDVNIMATDFFMGNDVINIAIEENTRRLNRTNIRLE